MPEALLRSQFAALETPDASEGDIVAVDITPRCCHHRGAIAHITYASTSTGGSGMIIDTLSAAAKNAFYPAVIKESATSHCAARSSRPAPGQIYGRWR